MRQKILQKEDLSVHRHEINSTLQPQKIFVDRHNRSKSMYNKRSSPINITKDKGILKVLWEFAENKKRLHGQEIVRRHSENFLEPSLTSLAAAFKRPLSDSTKTAIISPNLSAINCKENIYEVPYNSKRTKSKFFNSNEIIYKKSSSFRVKKPVSPSIYNTSFFENGSLNPPSEQPKVNLKLRRTLTPGRYSKSSSKKQNSVSFANCATSQKSSPTLNPTQRHSVTFQSPEKKSSRTCSNSSEPVVTAGISHRFSVISNTPIMTFCRRRSFSLNHDGGLVNDGDEVSWGIFFELPRLYV